MVGLYSKSGGSTPWAMREDMWFDGEGWGGQPVVVGEGGGRNTSSWLSSPTPTPGPQEATAPTWWSQPSTPTPAQPQTPVFNYAPPQTPAYTPPVSTPTPSYGTGFTSYLQQNQDLLNLWNMGDGNRGMFNGAGNMEEAGRIHWDRYGQYEPGRPTPWGQTGAPAPTGPAAPAGPSNAERAQGLVDQIKGLYNTVSGWGKGTSLNDFVLKQTERDNLLRELEGLGVANMTSLGRTYGGFIDQSYNDAMSGQNEARQYFNNFLTNFGGNAYAQAKNAPLTTNWQALLDSIDAADDKFDQYGFLGDMASEAKAARDRVLAAVNERKGQADAERTRIDEWETGVNSRLGSLLADLETMDLGGFDQNGTAYRQKLREIENEMRDFKGQLPFDLSQEIAKITSGMERWGELRSERDKEIARIQTAMQGFGSQGDQLFSMLSRLDAYNGAGMQQLENELARLKANSGSFQSKLDLGKYGGGTNLQGLFTQIEDGLGNLKAMQNSLLEKERGDLTGLQGRLASIEDWDEDSMNTLANLIAAESQGLSRFTGNATQPLRDLLDELTTGLTDKRTSLTSKRSTIEQELGALLDELNGVKFTSLDDVKAKRLTATQKGSDMRKYRASQAQDELDALLQLLSGEENRITTDLKAAQERDAKQAAATQSQVNRWGNLMVNGGVGYDPVTQAQLAALMRKRQVDQRLAPYSSPDYTAFSAALGF